MSWQDFYRVTGGDFGILPNSAFYGPQGHRGKDYIHDEGTPIPAYEHGIIVDIPQSSFLGFCVVVRLDDGNFAGWAHVANAPLGINAEVMPGDTIAHVAGPNDIHGSSWDGAHSHTTLGPSADSIFQGTVFDPVPRIQAALDAPGVAGISVMEDDMYTQEDRNRDDNIHAGLYKKSSVLIDGVVKTFNYGVLPIVAHNQELIAQQSARIAALESLVEQLIVGTAIEVDRDAAEGAATNSRLETANALPISEDVEIIDGLDVQNLPG